MSAWAFYTAHMSENFYFSNTIYCRYFNENGTELGSSYRSAVFPEYTVYCERRHGVKFMSLSDAPNGKYDYPVPLVNRTLKEPEHFLSVCVAALYGKEPKWLMLAELIEHYKLQGATHFYIYIQELDEYSRILVDDYIRTGEVEQIVLHDHSNRTDWKWHILSVLECLVRARGHSQWIIFGDLDERLITTDYPGTISDFIRNVKDPKIAALQFRQRWILRNDTMPAHYVNKSQILNWMPTRRYHNTSHVGPPAHTERSIIDPKKVDLQTVKIDIYLKQEITSLRHYRDVRAWDWGKNYLKRVEAMGNFSMTDYPKKFMAQLTANVQRRVHYVYGNDS
ncbi:unnamed protein product [Heligmosomoides polygyrus]|uniref:Glycosyltransferase family 92 protein n=1 Tax=Heligmosomoides polygyrus TaxID=6339 RepID=A0A183FVI6_HELPZ|nr:unnamed protein product [Heligmosomoides polygyrus]